MRIRRRGVRRAVTPMIATILMLGVTLGSGVVLWTFRPGTPSVPTHLEYVVLTGTSTPQWGDGSDCKTVNGNETCLDLPAIDIVFTGFSPGYVPVADLHFYLFCNGSVYLTATFAQMEIVPGSTTPIPSNAPQLQNCGTYVPPKAAFNRLAFFDQIDPGSRSLQPGDQMLVTAHTFEGPSCQSPGGNGACDDDFHGAPSWCYTVLNACSIEVFWATGSGELANSVIDIPLYALST